MPIYAQATTETTPSEEKGIQQKDNTSPLLPVLLRAVSQLGVLKRLAGYLRLSAFLGGWRVGITGWAAIVNRRSCGGRSADGCISKYALINMRSLAGLLRREKQVPPLGIVCRSSFEGGSLHLAIWVLPDSERARRFELSQS